MRVNSIPEDDHTMTTPLSQFPKPNAQQYQGQRKLFLVPTFMLAPDSPDEAQKLLDRYWTEIRDHVQNLEISLGTVSHVYHETVFVEGDQGLKLLEGLNPKGSSFVQAMCSSTAKLEATEDITLVQESSDWQRCISIGLMSQKVLNIALEGNRETTKKRYEHIGSRIDETLKEGEAGALFVREDHQVQFPADIRVFYVAPPALDALKRWISDQLRAAAQPPTPPDKPAETAEEPEKPADQPEETPNEEPEAPSDHPEE